MNWNSESQVTQWGGLAYFVSYLKTSGRQRLLRLTSTHLKAREIQASLTRIGEFMKRISASYRLT